MVVQLNYITPGSMLAAAIVPTVLSILAVVIRFWIRHKQKAPLKSDDWLLVPGLLLTIGIAIALIVGVAGHGIGYTKGLPPGSPPEAQLTYLAPNVVLTEQIEYACQLMQILALGFIKASFIMFYRRIFCTGIRTWFWYTTIVFLLLIIAWTISFFFVFVFYCGSNPWAEWNTVVNLEQYCPNGLKYQAGLAISDFIMDIMLILLPVPVISQLNMDTKRKLLVIGVFMFGLVALAASTARMAVFIIDITAGFDLREDGDKTIGLILFWSIIENGAGIVAACLPTMRFLFAKTGIQSIIDSIRGVISLHSLRSSRNTSQTSSRHRPGPAHQGSMSSGELALTNPNGRSGPENHISHVSDDEEKAEEGRIAVRKEFSRHEVFVDR